MVPVAPDRTENDTVFTFVFFVLGWWPVIISAGSITSPDVSSQYGHFTGLKNSFIIATSCNKWNLVFKNMMTLGVGSLMIIVGLFADAAFQTED